MHEEKRRVVSLLNYQHPMKRYGIVEVQLHACLTSALCGGEWSASRPGRFTSGTHWRGRWVGPRVAVDKVSNIVTFYKIVI
jgi:hypothetical protein